MKGENLKELVKQSGITLKALSGLSGIAERTISSLYKKDEIEQHYLDKLKRGLPNIAEYGKANMTKNNISDVYQTLLESKELTIKGMQVEIDKLKREVSHLAGEVGVLKSLMLKTVTLTPKKQ